MSHLIERKDNIKELNFSKIGIYIYTLQSSFFNEAYNKNDKIRGTKKEIQKLTLQSVLKYSAKKDS